MINNQTIRMARTSDAAAIAVLSRDLIESGLSWSWTPSRVVGEIRNKQANVIIATEGNSLAGFAVMRYLETEARLNLLAVHPQHRRQGIGKRLIRWLEETALVNGNGVVYLETRLRNHQARQFYQSLGYQIIQQIPRYYDGRETAVRMAHDLWSDIAIRE